MAAAESYEVAIGSAAGLSDVLDWNDVGDATSVKLSGLSLVDGATYYFNVRTVDSTGNRSAISTSSAWKVRATGAFSPRVGYPVPANGGNGTRTVALADLSGDGIPDLLATGNNSQLSYFPGIGNGSFGARVDTAIGCPGQTALPTDLNQNGVLDVAVTCFGTHLATFPGIGAGALGARVDYAAAFQETNGEAADLNGDNYPDVVTASYGNHSAAVMLNQGSGAPGTMNARVFTALTSNTATDPAQPKDVDVADVDGDGTPDLILTVESNAGAFGANLMVLLGVGDGTFGAPIATAVSGGTSLKEVALGDYNRDGILDAAVVNFGGASIAILKGVGDGTFTAGTSLTTSTSPYGVEHADLNGDGFLDLLVVNAVSHTLGIFLGYGDGTFMPQSSYATGTTPYRIAIADLNDDGLPDVAVSEVGDSVGVFVMSE